MIYLFCVVYEIESFNIVRIESTAYPLFPTLIIYVRYNS